jgi:K+-sensing histidine kinase KdpD
LQPVSPLLVALSAVLLTSVVLLAVGSIIDTEALAFIYLLPTMVMAMHYGSTAGVLTSFAGASAAAYFCFPPKFSFFISDPLNVAELGFFLLLAVIASKAVAVVTKDERVTRRPKRWNPSFRAISSVARIISSAHAFLRPAGRDREGPHRPGGDGGRRSPEHLAH